MKAYTLEVPEAANEDLVADILAALQKQRLLELIESPAAGNPALLSAASIEQDILLPGISLVEARTQFGV